jgi:hypothetical protein
MRVPRLRLAVEWVDVSIFPFRFSPGSILLGITVAALGVTAWPIVEHAFAPPEQSQASVHLSCEVLDSPMWSKNTFSVASAKVLLASSKVEDYFASPQAINDLRSDPRVAGMPGLVSATEMEKIKVAQIPSTTLIKVSLPADNPLRDADFLNSAVESMMKRVGEVKLVRKAVPPKPPWRQWQFKHACVLSVYCSLILVLAFLPLFAARPSKPRLAL